MKLPESISASILSSAFSCFPPGEKSSSSSSSQASLSRLAMYAANLVNSSGDNASTAFSISARLMKKDNAKRSASKRGWEYAHGYDACRTRAWNLIPDAIAQSGTGRNDLAKFSVEGEQHYWVHAAIDRFAGQVLDNQIEVVNE